MRYETNRWYGIANVMYFILLHSTTSTVMNYIILLYIIIYICRFIYYIFTTAASSGGVLAVGVAGSSLITNEKVDNDLFDEKDQAAAQVLHYIYY